MCSTRCSLLYFFESFVECKLYVNRFGLCAHACELHASERRVLLGTLRNAFAGRTSRDQRTYPCVEFTNQSTNNRPQSRPPVTMLARLSGAQEVRLAAVVARAGDGVQKGTCNFAGPSAAERRCCNARACGFVRLALAPCCTVATRHARATRPFVSRGGGIVRPRASARVRSRCATPRRLKRAALPLRLRARGPPALSPPCAQAARREIGRLPCADWTRVLRLGPCCRCAGRGLFPQSARHGG